MPPSRCGRRAGAPARRGGCRRRSTGTGLTAPGAAASWERAEFAVHTNTTRRVRPAPGQDSVRASVGPGRVSAATVGSSRRSCTYWRRLSPSDRTRRTGRRRRGPSGGWASRLLGTSNRAASSPGEASPRPRWSTIASRTGSPRAAWIAARRSTFTIGHLNCLNDRCSQVWLKYAEDVKPCLQRSSRVVAAAARRDGRDRAAGHGGRRVRDRGPAAVAGQRRAAAAGEQHRDRARAGGADPDASARCPGRTSTRSSPPRTGSSAAGPGAGLRAGTSPPTPSRRSRRGPRAPSWPTRCTGSPGRDLRPTPGELGTVARPRSSPPPG